MTPEQKKLFIEGMVAVCDYDNKSDFCPSDFGMKDIDYCRDSEGNIRCHDCATQACERFFEENNL